MVRSGINEDGFKRKTYLEIFESMKTRAKELFGENINLTEKSPLGMFLMATAWEISLAWQELENSYLSNYSMYAVGDALDKVVSNFGRARHPNIHAVGKVTIYGNDMAYVPKDFLVGTENGIMFRTLEAKLLEGGSNVFPIIAIEPGIASNVPVSTITKIINPLAGVSSVNNEEEVRDGADIETDESLRARHLLNLRSRLTGDNKPQYEVWAKNVKGVGAVKVKRATPTPGYVTITITNANNDVPSQELLDEVHNYIDELRPVNAGVIVAPASAINIDISVGIKMVQGANISIIQERMNERFVEYFNKSALLFDYLSISHVGKLILEIEGIADYFSLKLNGFNKNVIFGEMDFPKLGSITLEAV